MAGFICSNCRLPIEDPDIARKHEIDKGHKVIRIRYEEKPAAEEVKDAK